MPKVYFTAVNDNWFLKLKQDFAMLGIYSSKIYRIS